MHTAHRAITIHPTGEIGVRCVTAHAITNPAAVASIVVTSLCSTNLVTLYQPIWFMSISFSIAITILVVFNKIYLDYGIV